MRRALAPLLLALVPLASAAAQRPVPASQRAVEERLLPLLRIKGRPETHTLAERMAALKVPGVSVAVMKGGRLAWARGYGVRDAGTRTAVDTATLFQAASISKPVAALGMLRLVARGRLALDTDVNAWLHRWRLPDTSAAEGRAVTLRMIASHTAGLTVHGFPGYHADSTIPALPEILDGRRPANTQAVRVAARPGARFEYSGGGTTIEQLAMEEASGQPFEAFMAREVLGPLGMAHSTFAQPLPLVRWANAASGHDDDGAVVPGRAHVHPEMAAAGLWTTPADLARLLLATRRAVRGEDRRFLPDSLARQILVRQAGGPVGIGFFVMGEGDSLRFGHGGSNVGYRALAWVYRDSGDGAVVMTNSSAGQRLAAEILATIAATDGWPGFLGPEVEAKPVPAATLPAYEGRFTSERLPPVRIRREGDALVFQLEGDRALPLVTLGPEDFYLADANARVRFPGAPEAVRTMEVDLPGLSAVFQRAAD